MVLMLIGMLLLFVVLGMLLAAVIISISQGFKESRTWGLLNLFGALGCLAYIPNLIFCFTDFKERSGPIWLVIGSVPVLFVSAFLGYIANIVKMTGA